MNVLNCRGCGSLVYTSAEGFSRGCCPDNGGQEYNARNIYLELEFVQKTNIENERFLFWEGIFLGWNKMDSVAFAYSQIRIY